MVYNCSTIIKDFLFYMQTIKGRSINTVDGYYIDLRTFFRFINQFKNLVDKDIPFNEIKIDNIDIDIIKKITLSDIYEFLHFVSTKLENTATTRSRKVSSIRSFFNYLTVKVNLLDDNPAKELEVPSTKKSLPKYLSLEQSITLLKSVTGDYLQRDFCIITLFLNCGMRLSELVGLNINDISDNTIRLLGKGNKERIIYINLPCIEAINSYLLVRTKNNNNVSFEPKDKKALFLTRNGNRITARRVEQIIDENLKLAGLDNKGFSTHKLRHTAATLMYQQGNVDIRILQEILGHANLGTTQIYTHISNEQMATAMNNSPLTKLNIQPNICKNSKKKNEI
ncbi:MAG: tyrosine recombinase XerC [Oscillospiraceae bacterium]